MLLVPPPMESDHRYYRQAVIVPWQVEVKRFQEEQCCSPFVLTIANAAFIERVGYLRV